LRLVLLFAAVAGLTSLAYEVFWTRVLVFYMNNSVYAFSSMLTILLLGLALGGFLFGGVADRRKDLWIWLAVLEFLIGFWAIFAFPVLDVVFGRLAESSNLWAANFWGVPVYVKVLKSGMLILFPAVLMGGTFPLLSKLYTRSIDKLGQSVGNVYSRNTVGAMVGSFAAGFVLIPLLGIQKGVLAVAGINIGLALAALSLSTMLVSRRRGIALTMAVVAVLSLVLTPKQILFKRQDEQWKRLLFYKEDNCATVKVYERLNGDKVISINGYEVAGGYLSLQEIQKALGHYPLLLHKDPETALIIGFGAGGTSWAMHLHDLARIDLVEIVPSVLKAASYLKEINHGVLHAPNFHYVIDDGRNYVHATDKTYDVIAVDSIDPKHAGNGNLYTVEFFEDCRSKLNPGGIMAQWLPYHLMTESEFNIILKSFMVAFPNRQVWFTPHYSYFILVGSNEEIVVDLDRIRSAFENAEIAEDLNTIGLPDPETFANTFAMDERSISHYALRTDKLNTYDRPTIEFFTDCWPSVSYGRLP
jgi:spermidine synthase